MPAMVKILRTFKYSFCTRYRHNFCVYGGGFVFGSTRFIKFPTTLVSGSRTPPPRGLTGFRPLVKFRTTLVPAGDRPPPFRVSPDFEPPWNSGPLWSRPVRTPPLGTHRIRDVRTISYTPPPRGFVVYKRDLVFPLSFRPSVFVSSARCVFRLWLWARARSQREKVYVESC